jgi:hypothetical protein
VGGFKLSLHPYFLVFIGEINMATLLPNSDSVIYVHGVPIRVLRFGTITGSDDFETDPSIASAASIAAINLSGNTAPTFSLGTVTGQLLKVNFDGSPGVGDVLVFIRHTGQSASSSKVGT